MTVATPTPIASMPALVLDIDETAALLRCGRTTVFALLADEKIDGLKVGRRRLISYASVAAYVARQVAEDKGTPARRREELREVVDAPDNIDHKASA